MNNEPQPERDLNAEEFTKLSQPVQLTMIYRMLQKLMKAMEKK